MRTKENKWNEYKPADGEDLSLSLVTSASVLDFSSFPRTSDEETGSSRPLILTISPALSWRLNYNTILQTKNQFCFHINEKAKSVVINVLQSAPRYLGMLLRIIRALIVKKSENIRITNIRLRSTTRFTLIALCSLYSWHVSTNNVQTHSATGTQLCVTTQYILYTYKNTTYKNITCGTDS